jgi:Ca2+-binding RTX toxin-like protein
MLYDILAIQTLYGANSKTNAGDNKGADAYKFKTGADAVQAIWDANGVDEISAKDQTNPVTIDLRPGEFSFVGKSKNTSQQLIAIAFQPEETDTDGNSIYKDNYIENAIGGSGNDTLIGNDGNNSLEGNDGNDTLKGGAGNDTLIGGIGNDVLEGGADKDTLNGGNGFDTYIWKVGSNDVIIDSDMKGVIKIDTGTGNYSYGLGLFKETSPGSNVWTQPITGGGVLTVMHHSPWRLIMPDGSDIVLGDNWQKGDFGINLLSETDLNSINRTFTGDLALLDSDLTSGGIQRIADDLGNWVRNPDQPNPGYFDTFIGGNSNDLMQGLAGSDKLQGQGGADVLEGGDDSDILVGGSENDTLYAGNKTDLATIYDSDTVPAGNTHDWLAGNNGDDQLFGSAGSDGLAGGAGNDLMVGGAGNDYILGDHDWVAQTFAGTATNQNNII